MNKAIKVAIYAYVHTKGWCAFLHHDRHDKPWSQGCPLADRILLDLFPPMIFKGTREALVEAQKQGLFTPGQIDWSLDGI